MSSCWNFAGADVSSKQIEVATKNSRGECEHFSVANDPSGHGKLIRHLQRGTPVRIGMEATGVYGLDLALALSEAERIEVMVVNPRAARRFAEACMERAKTDCVDARSLREFVERMPFEPWQPPEQAALELRTLSRRIQDLVAMRAMDKNRLHAANASEALKVIRNDIEVNIRHLDRRVERLLAHALKLIGSNPRLRRAHELITSIKGVADLSGAQLLAELAALPADLTGRQLVAHAGLDPKRHQSGQLELPARISKQGNPALRAALYMPAHNAIQFIPQVREFYDRLVANGKKAMQAKVAVMRKLLVAVHAMLASDTAFDPARFTSASDVCAAA
jgi:transposase